MYALPSRNRSPRRIGARIAQFAMLVVVFVLPFTSGCKGSRVGGSGGTSEALRIGAVLPLTGDSAAWGEQGRWGIEFAVSQVNNAGGIDGHRVDVIFEDSQAVPRLAVTAFNKLSEVDKVPAVVGDIVSASTLAMAPLAEEHQVVLIAPTSSAPAITDAGDFVFRVWPSDLLEGSAAAEWAGSRGYRRASILHLANDYGTGLARVFRDRFERGGRQVVSDQSYSQDQTDFRANLARVRAEAPDVVYLVSYYKDAAMALRQARELGLSTQFLGATAVESPELLKLAGDAAEGLVYPTIVDFDPSNPTARQSEFIEGFRSLHGAPPDWAGSHSYDAALVIIEALRSGARTGVEIRAFIDGRRIFEGVTGTIHFDEHGDVIDKPVVMRTVRSGAFVVLGGGE